MRSKRQTFGVAGNMGGWLCKLPEHAQLRALFNVGTYSTGGKEGKAECMYRMKIGGN